MNSCLHVSSNEAVTRIEIVARVDRRARALDRKQLTGSTTKFIAWWKLLLLLHCLFLVVVALSQIFNPLRGVRTRALLTHGGDKELGTGKKSGTVKANIKPLQRLDKSFGLGICLDSRRVHIRVPKNKLGPGRRTGTPRLPLSEEILTFPSLTSSTIICVWELLGPYTLHPWELNPNTGHISRIEP